MSEATKAGAVLNSDNLVKIKDALNLLNEVLDSHATSPGAGKSADDREERAAGAVKTLAECAKAGPASRRAVLKGLEMLAMKASNVIPYKKEALAVAVKWDGAAEVKAATVEDLKAMCAWYDSSKPDSKGSYKLAHHTADGYKTVFAGVSAAMVALNGGRTPINIPAADKKGVYNHLKSHYADFDKPVPELKV